MAGSALNWVPFEGPQTQAYYSPADEVLYGGAAGGGKTDLILGLAGTAHRKAIIFRRVFPSMRDIIERSREIYNHESETHIRDSYNESLHIWRLTDGRIIEMGSMQYEKSKEDFRGRPHDLYAWDEVTEFTESQFRFVNAWNRSARWTIRVNGVDIVLTEPTVAVSSTGRKLVQPVEANGQFYSPQNQKCRIVATCNPPTTPEGRWILKYWGPWLDDKHPNPARVGELRWFIVVKGVDVEVDDDSPIPNDEPTSEDDLWIYPRSRTFIPALLSDNPALKNTSYRATLQGLPEPLRSQMLKGDFKAGMRDHAWQVIPTAWVDAAIARGKARTTPEAALTALGVDPSRGGDQFVIAPRYGDWFGPLVKHTTETMGGKIDGPTGAKLVSDEATGYGVTVNIDATGIGWSPYDSLKDMAGLVVNPVNNSESAFEYDAYGNKVSMFDKTGRFKLANVRTASYWKLREALDPESGQEICLPDDDELRADLTAPTYKVTASGYAVEAKHGPGSISERLGRSPDCGDAVVLAHWQVPSVPEFEFRFNVG